LDKNLERDTDSADNHHARDNQAVNLNWRFAEGEVLPQFCA
jgi:hypothetical protein